MADDPHDILAAEEFVLPGPDPALRHPRLPDDPAGSVKPHDVLAAEEFPFPAPPGPPPARLWLSAADAAASDP